MKKRAKLNHFCLPIFSRNEALECEKGIAAPDLPIPSHSRVGFFSLLVVNANSLHTLFYLLGNMRDKQQIEIRTEEFVFKKETQPLLLFSYLHFYSFLSLLPAEELSGAAFDSAGDACVEGGEAGFSDSMLASKLNAFVWLGATSRVGGVPVLDDAPDSSP